MKNKVFLLVTGLLLFGIIGFVNATVISGDFRTEADLGHSGPLVYQDLGATIDGGVELTGVDFLESPYWSGGEVNMDYDPISNILTFAPQEFANFQTFDAWINNIAFDSIETITGLTMLSNGITDPVIVPTFSFTSNSIHIGWEASHFYFADGIAEFQITTSEGAPVPEPATMILFGIGLLGLAGVNRRK